MKTLLACLCLAWLPLLAHAQPDTPPATGVADTALAQQLGADEHGMRHYVLVILKTGPNRMADGPQRSAMFQGHFANMQRLAGEGKLAVAGPFVDSAEGWRGLFILAVPTEAEAQTLVATDPVIQHGEMVAEYHRLYSSAALMAVNATHQRIAPQ